MVKNPYKSIGWNLLRRQISLFVIVPFIFTSFENTTVNMVMLWLYIILSGVNLVLFLDSVNEINLQYVPVFARNGEHFYIKK